MKKTIKLISVLFVALLFLIACASPENTKKETDKIQVVTSMFPVYEITKAIADDQADISVMVGANEDAHHYEPSAKAVASVNEADVFIYSSDEMEFWVESLLSVVENEDLIVVELGEGIDFEMHTEDDHEADEHEADDEDDHDGHGHGNLDPHFWLNPVSVAQQLPLIVDAFAKVDEAEKEQYEAKAASFSEELLAMDKAYTEAFATAKNRSFVVQHQAFGHLAAQYGLNQIAIGGLTTEVEPNPNQLAEIVELINDQQLPVIYYQSGESSAIAETISNETGTAVGVLYDLESLPEEFNTSNQPYMDAMKENLEQLKQSIQ